MKASEYIKNLIKTFEGYHSTPYICPGGKLTIGYGHTLEKDHGYVEISKIVAEEIFKKDIKKCEDAVNTRTTVNLNQNQFDALVSFVYNIGIKAFANSTLLLKLNKEDYQGAAKEFNRWIFSKGKQLEGLKERRLKETDLFLKEDINAEKTRESIKQGIEKEKRVVSRKKKCLQIWNYAKKDRLVSLYSKIFKKKR
jgi:lysozyme